MYMCTVTPLPHICPLILQLRPGSHTRKLISTSYNIGAILCVHLAHIHKSYCFMPTQKRPSYEPACRSSVGSYSVERLLEGEDSRHRAGVLFTAAGSQAFWWSGCFMHTFEVSAGRALHGEGLHFPRSRQVHRPASAPTLPSWDS